MNCITLLRIPGALFLIALLTCTVDRRLDELLYPDGTIKFYQPDGVSPAAGAMIKIFDACTTRSEPIAVSSTDEYGCLSLRGLSHGIYNIWVEKDSFVLFQDSIVIAARQAPYREAALEHASTITGIVGLQNYHDVRTIAIEVAGMERPAIVPDAQGRFTISGLASGAWTLHFRSTIPEYLPTAKTVAVSAWSNDTIDDTLLLYFAGIPTVSGISFSQDTLAGTIKLTWKKPVYKLLRDFLIYHDSCNGITYSKEPSSITEDTFCIDSMYFPLIADSLDTMIRCLNYRIAVRNSVPKIGAFCSGIEVPFVPKAYVTTFFTHQVRDAKGWYDSASINDTVTISLTAKNRTRPLRSLIWYNPAANDTISTKTIPDRNTKTLNDSLRYSFKSEGTKYLIAIAADYAGITRSDTVPVQITRNTLTADAGPDTFVLSCDTIHLHGTATSQFGGIAKWEWKIGMDGAWNRTSAPDTVFAAAPFSGTVPCSLAVTDLGGYRAFDYVNAFVTVIPDPKPVKIASGGYHDLLLDADGKVTGWGVTTSGQLGLNSVSDWLWEIPLTTNAQSVDAGECHSLILKTNKELWACGCNRDGQIGNGSFENGYTLVPVASNVQRAAAGGRHSLILSVNGTLWAVGFNQYGQLGDGSTATKPSPVQVMNDVKSMSAGKYHSLILKNDSSLWACGGNGFGQLGDGSTTNRLLPVKVMTGVRDMAAGGFHSLVLTTDGTLWACGWNYAGQLGDGTTIDRSTPIRIMTDVQSIAAGDYHSAILKTDKTLWTCGENGTGQLGDSTLIDRLTPVNVMSDVQSIDAGYWQTMVLKTNGTVWAFGWISSNANSYGATANTGIPMLIFPW